jgi:hypothetical protein
MGHGEGGAGRGSAFRRRVKDRRAGPGLVSYWMVDPRSAQLARAGLTAGPRWAPRKSASDRQGWDAHERAGER